MNNPQFPPFEFDVLFTKLFVLFNKNKILNGILYILILIYFSIPSFQITELNYLPVQVSSLMEQRAIEHHLIFLPAKTNVKLKDVNPLFIKSLLAMEDDTFFKHKGINWRELNKSISLNKRKGKKVRGASTITMQLAKNLFLRTDKSIIRKIKEFVIAFRMEKELSKATILQTYINIVEWGENIFGIQEASKKYFNKPASKLTLDESARLVAVIPSPLKHKPNQNSSYVLYRASIIKSRIKNIIFP